MLDTLLDFGGDDKQPVFGTRIVLLHDEYAGDIAHVTGIDGYWSAFSGEVVYTFTSEEGKHLLGGRNSFVISPYQDEELSNG